MLHVTTEVGKPGKKEREKRHFPFVHNIKSDPKYKPRGRKYIPHNYGTDIDWVPHGQYIEHEPTESGPDWSSRLRYIPDPENPDYPAPEIWPNNWKSMRPFPSPLQFLNQNNNGLDSDTDGETSELYLFGDRGKRKWTYMRSSTEWLLDPSLTKLGKRCVWNGVHKASARSHDEITHTALYGRVRPGLCQQTRGIGTVSEWLIDKRNGLPQVSPGDNGYQIPEYSPGFHKLGSTRPLARYGPPSPYPSGTPSYHSRQYLVKGNHLEARTSSMTKKLRRCGSWRNGHQQSLC
ncbi:uncharacterized protein LOC112565508 isoform X2 [Pomacea canaliculata]|uniref:uncharacterized protein LOC112565508 isoform X2 n=1 Tax=Pomacea canaliculata TaxID=400727 RepID=UPI000D72FC0D|nr:uncharacterized protein LOC112565508 isoform X2 [Pomacea canaliculata]